MSSNSDRVDLQNYIIRNPEIKKDYNINMIADNLQQLQFHLEIIAKYFKVYEYSKEKEGFMKNIGCHFSLINILLKTITDELREDN